MFIKIWLATRMWTKLPQFSMWINKMNLPGKDSFESGSINH